MATANIVFVDAPHPKPPKQPTVRLWDKYFKFVAGCEPLSPPERAGDGWLRIRIAKDSDVARALIGDNMFSLNNITVDLPFGRFCGRMSEWATGDELTVTAQDLSTGMAWHIIPPAPPVHSLPPEPGPVVVTPEQVERLAERIVRALKAQNPEQGAYIGQAFNLDGGARDDYLTVDGVVDFRKVAAYMLTHPED